MRVRPALPAPMLRPRADTIYDNRIRLSCRCSTQEDGRLARVALCAHVGFRPPMTGNPPGPSGSRFPNKPSSAGAPEGLRAASRAPPEHRPQNQDNQRSTRKENHARPNLQDQASRYTSPSGPSPAFAPPPPVRGRAFRGRPMAGQSAVNRPCGGSIPSPGAQARRAHQEEQPSRKRQVPVRIRMWAPCIPRVVS
jgi:hypothetical protein